jgi:hypothetical protein
MSEAPSLAVRLYGTEEPVPPIRILKAGDLTAELDSGNLRHIRYGGVEIMRAVSYIVRDKNWGTYNPDISKLDVKEQGDSFSVTYEAVTKDAAQEFRYSAQISGHASGKLEFKAQGKAVTDFVTNRTGFVVLHPIAGVSGHPAEIEHVDGKKVNGRFPEIIDPVQPMMNLRALTHEAAPGLKVTCRMEGDTFEMEDQRNWTDASYKTYVRPLALPWPYTLDAGTVLDQAVTLTVSGKAASGAGAGNEVSLRLGPAGRKARPVGLGYDAKDAAGTREHLKELAELHPAYLVIHHDPRSGHDRKTLEEGVSIASALGAAPWLEAVVTSVEGFEAEVNALGETAKAMGSPFQAVLLSPAPDLKCTLPGSVWPPAPPADRMFKVARKAFPQARLGGGMFSFFTELNRKRPPVELLDFVSFTTSAMVHAGDDHSVTEGLEALPFIAASTTRIAGNKPWAVGPSAIGMRMNPYGAAPMENPNNIRQAMNYNDPRQRGLLGAAWILGYYAHFANGGAEAISFGGTTGAFGLLHAKQSWPQPWYDKAGGLYPAYHVVRGLAGLAGHLMHPVEISQPSKVQAVAAETDAGLSLWVANLTGEKLKIELPQATRAGFVLDATSFATAASDTKAVENGRKSLSGTGLTLDAYGVANLML